MAALVLAMAAAAAEKPLAAVLVTNSVDSVQANNLAILQWKALLQKAETTATDCRRGFGGLLA